ncbi:MAG: efflux RND transporter periplasmic adaptor subunit [Verrucomicrobiales bacterium]
MLPRFIPALSLVLGLASCQPPQSDAPRRVVAVATKSLPPPTEPQWPRIYVGEVEATGSGPVAFELSGLIKNLTVEVGDQIQEGQALAALDTERLLTQKNELSAALLEVEAQLELAELTLARRQDLRKRDVVSPQDFDEAQRDVRTLRAGRERAIASLARIQVDLEKSVLRAPYDATVDARHAESGQVIQPGQPILELTRTGQREIRVSLPARMQESLAADLQVSFHNPATGEPGEAILRRWRQARDLGTRALVVYFEVTSGEVTPRSLVEVQLPSRSGLSGWLASRQAIQPSLRGLWSAFVARPLDQAEGEATHRLERVELEWLDERGELVLVRGALKENDLMVTQGVHALVPGQHVQLLSPNASVTEARSSDRSQP